MKLEELLLLCNSLAGNKAQSRCLIEVLCDSLNSDDNLLHRVVQFISKFQHESYFVHNWMLVDNAVEFDEYFSILYAQGNRKLSASDIVTNVNSDWEEIKSLIFRNLEEHESLSPGETRTMNSEINRIVDECSVTIDSPKRHSSLPILRSFNFDFLVISHKLDSGSFGDVHLGSLRGIPVAIKKQRISGMDFRKEAMILQLRSLPGVIRFFGVDDPENPTMIVMEAGVCSLSGWLYKPEFQAELGELTLERKLRVLLECATTLAFLHSLNVLHRDIKPGNIIIMRSGKIKLSDFGCARLFNDKISEPCSTTAGILQSRGTTVVGTMAYLAPELMLSEQCVYSSATDLYAFAITMNEVLIGVVPHKDLHSCALIALMNNNCEHRPDLFSLPSKFKELEEKLRSCVLHGWDSSPGERQTASIIAHYLEEAYEQFECPPLNSATDASSYYVENVLIASGHTSAGYYTGWMKANKRHGIGLFKGIDGLTYNGDWKDDMMHGEGEGCFAAGSVYDGKWKRSGLDNFGVFNWEKVHPLFLWNLDVASKRPETEGDALQSLNDFGGAAGFHSSNQHFQVTDGPIYTVLPSESFTNEGGNSLANELIPEIFVERRRLADGTLGDIVSKYSRGRVLGKGAFAKVFVCVPLHDSPKKYIYAIKVVAKVSLVKPRTRQKFQTEVEIHRSLNHVNIVRYENFFQDSHFSYIVMDLCNNNSMSELMQRRKRLSEPEARFFLIQIVNALQYLHSNLVIHRDLKLGNLFLDDHMCMKVGDLGLAARLAAEDERRKTFCGTPNYIAPEILEGKNGHSFEVDVWSTGVILYTVLVGKPPFETNDIIYTYKRIMQNIYSFPEGVTVSSDAKNLIRMMLQPFPEERPSLSKVLEHPFFARPTNYTPRSLPDSALRECPEFPLVSKIRGRSSSMRQPSIGVVIVCTWNSLNIENIEKMVFHSFCIVDHRLENIADVAYEATANKLFAKVWVVGYVDYTSKYGLGFLFNTGSVGVYFNDSTKIILSAEGTVFQFFERHPGDTASTSDFVVQSHLTTCYPMELQKKVTLLKHFKNYLMEQQKNMGNKFGAEGSDANTLNDLMLTDNEMAEGATSAIPFGESSAIFHNNSGEEETVVEKCMKTDHAILFRMSNHTVQVIFNDKSEIFWSSESGVITYVKQGVIADQSLNEILECGRAEIAKRLKYIKEVHYPPTVLPPELWVVGYVDYTSKYGLGFLFNTGSVGVYFNDSTKIILSAEGTVFQYIEQCRDFTISSDFVVQSHLITCYPMELRKKVTLLKHFKNYLMEQQKNLDNSLGPEDSVAMDDCTQKDNVIGEGATSAIPFGESSAKYRNHNSSGEEEMPFLKKWVKTKHAILFQMSNRTVQVIFYDKSEILLSSEGGVLTYVNSQGERTVRTLNEIRDSGRLDIAKRLKYTKDIMHRLNNG